MLIFPFRYISEILLVSEIFQKKGVSELDGNGR